MVYVEGIIDRTSADVTYALAHQEDVADLKGAWNVSDMNRCIDNVAYLVQTLRDAGYAINSQVQTHVTAEDYPHHQSLMNVLRGNVVELVTGFYTLNHPVIPDANTFDYLQANDLENSLKLTNILVTRMQAGYQKCGVAICGQEVML